MGTQAEAGKRMSVMPVGLGFVLEAKGVGGGWSQLSLVTCGSCAIPQVALGSRLLPASDWPWLWGSQVPEASE